MEAAFYAAEGYLRTTLGLELDIRPWKSRALPDYLRTRYTVRHSAIGESDLLLLLAREQPAVGPNQLIKDAEQIERLGGASVAIVLLTIDPYLRKRLVEHRRGFVVPGLHAYLPSLFIDASEKAAPRPARKVERLSPSTQAVFLHFFYAGHPVIEAVRDSAKRLPYSAMTLSRAISELEQSKIVVTESSSGRRKEARFDAPWHEVWSRALPFLRSPVRRTIPVNEAELRGGFPQLLAGVSALSYFSDLAEPRKPVFAMHVVYSAANRSGLRAPPPAENEDEATAIVQQWTYAPLRETAPMPTVDRLSLYLSLRDDADVRVQAALEKMLEEFFHAKRA